jgi:hypothetical protein
LPKFPTLCLLTIPEIYMKCTFPQSLVSNKCECGHVNVSSFKRLHFHQIHIFINLRQRERERRQHLRNLHNAWMILYCQIEIRLADFQQLPLLFVTQNSRIRQKNVSVRAFHTVRTVHGWLL